MAVVLVQEVRRCLLPIKVSLRWEAYAEVGLSGKTFHTPSIPFGGRTGTYGVS